jgi:hypothetical protein
VSRLTISEREARIIVRGRAELLNSVRLDGIILTTDGIVREINVGSTGIIQTPGYIHVSKSKSGEVDGVKFILTPSTSYSTNQQVTNKPFIYSEGGSAQTPVVIRSSTFTVVAGSLGSLSYNILEVVDGTILIVGCTFSDMTMNPVGVDDGVIVVKNAAVTLKNSIFSNISLDTNADMLGRGKSECEWGCYSVMVVNEAVSLVKDTVFSNTFASIFVHGGTAVVEGSSFTAAGTQPNSKYPSVERHLKCGMLYIIYIHIYLFFLLIKIC